MHRSLIFFYLLISFILGIFAGSFFNISQSLVLALALISVVLIALFYRRGSKLLNVKVALVAFLTLSFVLGILRFNTVSSRQNILSRLPEASRQVIDPEGKQPIKVSIIGYIDSEPEVRENSQRFIFYTKWLESSSQVIQTEERVLVTTKLYPEYSYGQKLSILGELKEPENFDDFDYKSYLAKDSIFTTVSFPEIKEESFYLSFLESLKAKVFTGIFYAKGLFQDSIRKTIPEPNAGFIEGILVGERSQIPEDLSESFSRTSTSHILAVSGYNITIIAMIISWFLLLFFRRPTAFWFSIIGVVVFTILTGAQASVVRSAIMGILVLLAQREGRLSDPRNAIALTAAVMIFLNPRILRHDIGFQLSFMATLGLIYAAPIIEKYSKRLPNIFSFRETLVATGSAQLLVLPLLLFYFNNLSLVSLPTNILILPVIPFAMLTGFISGIAGMILPFLGQIVGYFAWLLTAFQIYAVKLFSTPSWAVFSVNFSWYMIIVSYLAIIVLLKKLNRADKKTA
ncbi:MAG: ComEC/Rec2 family competence protein [Candidatus Paceibacterota bacterium]